MSDSSHPSIQALMAESDWVRALARGLVGDPSTADDLAQDTLVRALERPPRDGRNLRGWLARVLRNLHMERRRRLAMAPTVEGEVALPSTLELVERAEVHRNLVDEVLSLEEPYRSTVLLRYFEDLTPSALAERLDIPLATVTSRLTRAHERLRERLDRRGGEGSWRSAVLPLAALGDRLPHHSTPTLLFMSTKLKIASLSIALVGLGFVAVRGFGPAPAPAENVSASLDPGDSEVDGIEPITSAEGAERAAAVLAPAPEATASSAPALAGRVLTAEGEPAAGAHVVLGTAGLLQFIEEGKDPAEDLSCVTTDAEGRFAFEAAASGSTWLTAGRSGSAPSESALVEVDAETPTDDLVLQLRVGARIHGDVVRSDGSIARHRKVRLMQSATETDRLGKRLVRHVSTDENGRFDERHLCPGPWGLVTMPEEEELEELGGTSFEHLVQQNVEVADGEEAFVVLGAPSSETLVVTGSVTLAGEPAKALVQWIGEFEDPMSTQKLAQGGVDGHYEVTLEKPGAYYVKVMGPLGVAEYYVDVARGVGAEHDFQLPGASFSGRVVDPSGVPIEGAVVSHMRIEGTAYRFPMSAGSDRKTTDEEGSFLVKGAAPGLYQLGATHPELGSGAAQVRVEGESSVEDLVIVLQTGRAFSGVVFGPDGLPTERVPIWIQDTLGNVLNPVSKIYSDAEGRFETSALAPGEYALVSSRGVLTAMARGLRNDGEEVPPIELHLREGGHFVVTTRVDGEAVRAHVSVHDLEGRPLSGLRDVRDPWSWQRYPFDSLRKHVGPLPAGTFVVRAHVPGRGTVSAEHSLTPGEAGEVTLRLE